MVMLRYLLILVLSTPTTPYRDSVISEEFFDFVEDEVNGNWGSWTSWKINSVTGEMTRTRACNNPTPQYGGQYCVGSSTDRVAFPVNGNWGSWGSWKINSGTGEKTRTRPCNNPTPKNGGQYCVGSSTDSVILTVDGGWGDWGTWSTCDSWSREKRRSRKCDNPTPLGSGELCSGDSEEKACCEYTVICPRLTVTKAYYASSNGEYVMMPGKKVNCRAVYKRTGGSSHDRFLYYHQNHTQWSISYMICGHSGCGGGFHNSGHSDIEPWTTKWKHAAVVNCQ